MTKLYKINDIRFKNTHIHGRKREIRESNLINGKGHEYSVTTSIILIHHIILWIILFKRKSQEVFKGPITELNVKCL